MALGRLQELLHPGGRGGQTAEYRACSKDAFGSVEGLEDENGEVGQDRYEYDPYGAQTCGEGPLSDDAKANPFRFQGHYYDSGQQTYDMRARAYLPEIGRFLQEDHFEDAAGDMALEIYRHLFREQDQIPGGTAGAIREAGDHIEKGRGYVKNLDRILNQERLTDDDFLTAIRVRNDLYDALKSRGQHRGLEDFVGNP
jgi:RHS repeat-associated protein